MIVKLGTPFSRPLLRTNAVRREISACVGSRAKVTTFHLFSSKSEIGPRSTLWRLLLEEPGQEREARGGQRHDHADQGAEAERRALEEAAAREALARLRLGAPAALVAGSSVAVAPELPAVRSVTSRAQRKPKTSASAAPTAATHQLTTRPTRRQTMPTAKPTGQRLGCGSCGRSSPGRSSKRFSL